MIEVKKGDSPSMERFVLEMLSAIQLTIHYHSQVSVLSLLKNLKKAPDIVSKISDRQVEGRETDDIQTK